MGQVEAVLRVLTDRLSSHTLPDWLILLQGVVQAPFHLEQPPLCGSDRSGLYSRIESGFKDLSTHIDDACDELLDLITHYAQMAQQWRRGAHQPPSGG